MKIKTLTLDLSPLRKYPDFRRLWFSGLISYMGSMITYVALPFQIKELTHSYIAVGALGAVELLPLIIFGLYGGVLADRVDRKKMIWGTEFAALISTSLLLLNSFRGHPYLLPLYFVAGAFAMIDGLQRPSSDAILPRLVEHHDLPSATTLMSLRWQIGVIVGPSLAGLLISTAGISSGFLVDILTYVVSLLFLARVRSVLPREKSEAPALTSLLEGISYAFSRKDLLGTYIVDLAAMFFAMPNALFPFWADQLHARWALGLFYASGTIGSLMVTLSSGWIRRFRWYGWAIALAAACWGGAISLAGMSHSLSLTIFFLIVAGASDMVSALCRGAIWNQSIPDELRGRLAGIELLSYSVGPLGGQMRAGAMAAWTNLRTSVISGGLLCIGFVSLATGFLTDFRNFDRKTNKFAIAESQKRKKEQNQGNQGEITY